MTSDGPEVADSLAILTAPNVVLHVKQATEKKYGKNGKEIDLSRFELIYNSNLILNLNPKISQNRILSWGRGLLFLVIDTFL